MNNNFRETFKDRVESQEELWGILERCFGTEEKINSKTFTNITENIGSEIFLYILFFLLESRPFRSDTLDAYDPSKKNNISKSPQVTIVCASGLRPYALFHSRLG